MADQLYDALSKVKEEFGRINTAIYQEEDALFALGNTVKELEETNKVLTSNLAQLEMAAQLAESEATVAAMKKEDIVRRIDGLRNEIFEAEAKLDQKDCNLQDLTLHLESKEKEFEDLQRRNHAKYMEIPCLRKYAEASEHCAYFSETVSRLAEELNCLKVEHAKLTGQPGNNDTMVQAQVEDTFIETITLDQTTPVPPSTNSGLGVPMYIQEIFAKLMEENQLLKARLERLEMSQATANQLEKTSAVPIESGATSTSIPFMNQEAPANTRMKERSVPHDEFMDFNGSLQATAIQFEKTSAVQIGSGATSIPFMSREAPAHTLMKESSVPHDEFMDFNGSLSGGSLPLSGGSFF